MTFGPRVFSQGVMTLKNRIETIVHKLKTRYETNNPFEIIDALGIELFRHPLGKRMGCYMLIQRSRCIFLNTGIENEYMERIVAAHELGHAILHPKINCCFLRNYTLYSKDTHEIEANKFAAELLLPDDIFLEYQGYTINQIAAYENVIPELIKLKS